MSEFLEGLVIRRSASEVRVDTGAAVLSCVLRGKMRRTIPCVAGDRVLVAPTGPGTGVLEDVLPRRTELRRGKGSAGEEGLVLAANLDLVGVMIAFHPAPPRWALADRLLVEASRQGIDAFVLVNKADLAPALGPQRNALDEALQVYRGLGLRVIPCSAVTGEGLSDVEEVLRGRITVLSGHSGVGKTTLVNRILPDLDLAVGDVNPTTGKGRHTTTFAAIYRLPQGGWIADTPGFREFALAGLSPQDLGRHYGDFLDAISRCRFRDCLHSIEPGCAVKAAVGSGGISKLRYQNYLQILEGLVEKGDGKPFRKFRKAAPPTAS